MDIQNVEQAGILDQQIAGSLDAAPPPIQMKAVDVAMRHYFGADDWLNEREKSFSGLLSNSRLVHEQKAA